jgi:hypothetical protein
MNIGRKLLQRFGLFAQKSEGPDAFDLRLQRIGSREARVIQRKVLFRPALQPLEA